MTPGNQVEMLQAEEIERIVEKINQEKDAEAATRRGGGRGQGQGAEQTVLAARPAGEQ